MSNILNYLRDQNLTDNECRIVVAIRILADDKSYLNISNKELGAYVGKSENAIAKIVHLLCKKEYLKSDKDRNNRRLDILK